MQENNGQLALIKTIDKLFAPVELAVQNPNNAKELLNCLGWDINRIDGFPTEDLLNAISNIYDSLLSVRELLIDPPETISEFVTALGIIKSLFTTEQSVQDFINDCTEPSITASFKSEFLKLGEDLLNFIFTGYLKSYSPRTYATLCVLGIIEPSEIYGFTPPLYELEETWVRLGYLKSTIHLNKIVDLIHNPEAYFKDEFYPASGNLNTPEEAKEFSDKFFPRLVLLFQSFGFEAHYGIDENDAILFTPDSYSILSRALTVEYNNGVIPRFGATFVISPTYEGNNGLVVKLFGEWVLFRQIKEWLIKIQIDGSINAFSINNSGFNVPTGGIIDNFNIELGVIKNAGNKAIGSTSGTQVNINYLDVKSKLSYTTDSGLIYGFELTLKEFNFRILGGDGDGFIQKILPNGIGGSFDTIVGWDSRNGFHFSGSGSLELELPAHISLGPINIDNLILKIGIDNNTIPISVGATIRAKLGPVIATVENIGLKAIFSFPTDGGNLGVCNLAFGFKLPNGIALTIKASVVEGSGYLYIDSEKGLYYGAIELKIKDKIGVSAVGIITTKAPDGSDGFSLLILANVTFPGLPLGMGFTLNGVGGMGGVNRGLSPEAIRQGVQSGNINDIMFPEHAVDNIHQIITDLQQFFPIQEKQYTFGLFFLLKWGVGVPLVNIKLGLIISLPEPTRLAIIGNINILLPNPDAPVLVLNVAFAGIIDFDNKYLTFDATIYDSKIVIFSLSGDIAVRLFWGRYKELLMSAGGFHPSFSPPTYLQLPATMKRLTFGLEKEHYSLILTSYFATTSNTVQFGAHLLLHADFGPVEASGHLGFDALFQFNPFHFITSIDAGITVYFKGKELMGVELFFELEGPTPWHASGHAEFTLCGFSKNVQFDKTWNEEETATTLPGIQVQPLIKAALEKPDSLNAVLPDNKQQVSVKLKQLGDAAIVHPFGVLQITQKVAPLGVSIQKLGSQQIDDGGYYDITEVTIGEDVEATSYDATSGLSSVNENFAPAQYRDMDSAQKLKAPGFEYMKGGIEIHGTDELLAKYYSVKQPSFEIITVDNPSEILAAEIGPLPSAMVNGFTKGGAISKSPMGKKVRKQLFEPFAKVKVEQERYKLVSKDSLVNLSDLVTGVNETYFGQAAAASHLDTLVTANPGWKNNVMVVPEYINL